MKSAARLFYLVITLLPLVASQLVDSAMTGTTEATRPTVSTNNNNDGSPVKGYQSFLMAISMISASEIGDKTFLIAALMAMRNSRWIVFSASATSLAIMTVLSGLAGHTFVSFIPEYMAKLLAAGLFFVFGYKLCKEGLAMDKNTGVEEELAEVEEELAADSINAQNDSIESGTKGPKQPETAAQKFTSQIYNLASLVLSPLWIQIFVMIFLAEFGDRSQISIIALASDSQYWYVIAGAVIGHIACTGVAIIGGMLLAGKISLRNVTLAGSACFFLFGIIYLYDAVSTYE
ncbi:hypothetical protein TBLA_0H03700 [Henningerozyma blattae CBS 6284]|uniref:GDT1 family protein n=1 Tax=Henningerozyma blattae (strain ATCC 34711 / CBS 6284 / DSM 70876 / NBRC 10599 / NRRL Y-10934 / UCD 77-7) TaxID=1071380 RepID=I2H8F0_HENB6|nr:hypothetical protein TBLA_0H03700 [Tetrapisispora blattae CBS 6284]CCH62652.1 hypothetical protein TBLA_0H03700 [Tetrapisispora blattae CBS 6284]